MNGFHSYCSAVAIASLVVGALAPALSGQEASPPAVAISATVPVPEPAAPAGTARADKTALMVMGFESGTVTAQVRDKRGFGAILAAMHGGSNNEQYDPSQLGTGIADMLIEKLLETGQFRLLERKPMVPAAATMGLLSYKQHKTEVTLTARVVNAATGEIVASMTGEGISRKGGGLRVAGIGSGGGGGADISSSNFKSTAIGEATERAVSSLAEKIVQKKTTF